MLDGKRIVKGHITGSPSDSVTLGVQLAEQLIERGGKEILDSIRTAGQEPLSPEA